jgi:hypothetical protein
LGGVEPDTPRSEDLDGVRAERDEWRRRAEVAEAVAAERLLRAEAAERALAGAEAALAHLKTGSQTSRQPLRPGQTGPADEPDPPREPRPRSLLERWRRYTDTIN